MVSRFVHLDDPRRRRHVLGLPPRGSDGDDEIRPAQHVRGRLRAELAHHAHVPRMVRGEQTKGGHGVHDGDLQPFGQLQQRPCGLGCTDARKQHGVFRFLNHCHGPLHRPVVGAHRRAQLRRPLRQFAGRHRLRPDVLRHTDAHRPRSKHGLP